MTATTQMVAHDGALPADTGVHTRDTLTVESPEIQYARSGDIAIAYQVVGTGSLDLVYVPLNLSIAVGWEHELVRSFYERLAAFSRLILFDKRGTGISDRPRTPPTLEMQMDDVRAVLDAVGSEQAVLFGSDHGAQMCALFAATYPERTKALILYNGLVRVAGSRDEQQAFLRRIRTGWGSREWIENAAKTNHPSLADDPEFMRWFAKVVRISASPGAAVEFLRTVVEADVSEVLPVIRVPTLVLYRRDVDRDAPSLVVSLEQEAERIADLIPDARLIAIPGCEPSAYFGAEVTDEVERFLSNPAAQAVPDTVLATVLFTDIVGSTQRAADLGDRRWSQVLSEHRQLVRRELARFRGHETDTAGDGFLATFDGPARAIECARAIRTEATQQGLQLRCGIHTGECELVGGKVAGLAVHIGARIASEAVAGEIIVSRTVKDLVAGSELQFDDRGTYELKGVPGKWQLFVVS